MDLIYEHPKRIGAEYCKKTIDAFEVLDEMNATRTRHDSIRRDTQINLSSIDDVNLRNTELAKDFFDFVKEAVEGYQTLYGLEKIFPDGLYYKDMLVQRSRADMCESYSTWHCEVSAKMQLDRALVYILYLNDDYEGGETQFLYQKKNITPERGKLVLFPPYFTHIHRGNMLTEGTKYIATGWCFL